jgi:hypothetical protein
MAAMAKALAAAMPIIFFMDLFLLVLRSKR